MKYQDMNITDIVFDEMEKAFGLDDVPFDVRQAIINQFGTEILTVALGKFLEKQGEWEQVSFESWISEHSNDVDMVGQLVTMYPDFGNILVGEILAFKKTLEETNE
jgi:hypothetical protein